MENHRKLTSQLIAGFIASLSTLCVGFHMGWPTPSLPKLLAEDSDILITSAQSSWIVSFMLIGGTFGPFVAALLDHKLGRKLSLLMTVIPFTGSCILIVVAQNHWWLMVARLFAGIAIGMVYTILPMYLGEISDDRIRGAIATIFSVMSNAGTLLAYCVGPWVSRVAFAILGGSLPLIFGLLFVWMPESPYVLVMKNKLDRAEKSIKWLKGSGSVREELKKVEDSVEFDQRNAATMKDLVLIPGNRKALFIICGLMLAQQFSGINAILAYSGLIFEASGSTLDSSISVIIIGVVQLLSGVLTVFTVDLAGRRVLLLLSSCGTIIFLAGEALYYYLQSIGNDVSSIWWLPVTALVGYMIFYMAGLGCVPHVILSEMFPCNVKTSAAMIYSVTAGIGGVVVTTIYQLVADAYGIYVGFLGFAIMTVCSVFFIYFILPETKQRSFRDIQNDLHKTTESTTALEKSNDA